MSIATVTLTGFVAIEPRLWFTKQSHTPVVNLRVGATPRRMDLNAMAWKDGPSSFFTVNCWRKLALNASASLHKGDPVIIRGQLRMRTWNDNGKTRSVVEIEAESIGHDIGFGWSHFMRGVHPKLQQFLPGAAMAEATGEPAEPGGAAESAWSGGSAAPAWSTGADEFTSDHGLGAGSGYAGPVEPGSAEPASGPGPSAEGGSDEPAAIMDGELASEAVPF